MATRRSPLLVAAILVVFLSCGFNITSDGLQWFWAEAPWVAALLAVVGIALGMLHFSRRARSGV